MPARSLEQMAVAKLIQHKDAIEDIGGIPYKHIERVLVKLERPEQLHTIETNSPHLLGQTSDIWLHFLRRDVQGYDQNPVRPEDGKSWYRVYRRALQQAKKRQEQHELQLMASFRQKQEERDRNLATVSDKTVIPGSERRKKQQSSLHPRTGNPALLGLTAGSRTRTDTGAGIMRKIRRETADHRLRMTVLGSKVSGITTTPPPRAPRPDVSPGQQSSQLHARRSTSSAAPTNPIRSALPTTYRLPARTANPLLSTRDADTRPGATRSPGPARTEQQSVQSPMRLPQQPRRKTAGTGVFMPATKRRRV